MDSTIKLSVVVPVYNIEERLLRRCIESILRQTETNLELILVDDGSTNDALSICNSYKADARVTVIHQKNGGVSVARNTGLDLAGGEWIMFVDPDDYILPECVSVLLGAAQDNEDVVQCCCHYYMDGDNKQKYTAYFFNEDKVFDDKQNKIVLYRKLLGFEDPKQKEGNNSPCGIGAPWAKIFRAKLLYENKIRFDPELRRVQDGIFNLDVLVAAKKIRYVNRPLYVYNYEHLKNLHLDFNPKVFLYYKKYAEARYWWFKKNEGFLSDIVKDSFYIGSYGTLLFVLNYGPFHPRFPGKSRAVRKECNSLMDLDCFVCLKKWKKQSAIKIPLKRAFLIFLFKNRLWLTAKKLLALNNALSGAERKNKEPAGNAGGGGKTS